MGGSSNLSLIKKNTVFQWFRSLFPSLDKELSKFLAAVLAAVLFFILLAWFFSTHLGLCIRATGDNEDMVRASSINVDATKIMALAVSNACAASSGAIIAQYQGYADIDSGIGTVVVGLASVIIGEVLLGRRSVTFGLFSAMAGFTVYRIIIAIALKTKIFPTFALKLVSASIVAIALALPEIRRQIGIRRIRREALNNVGD